MLVKGFLNKIFTILQQGQCDTPYLDAVVLLADCLNISKERLYASFQEKVTRSCMDKVTYATRKRLAGYPVAYLIGKKEFYGLDFYVDERVLVPRPDTEVLVDTIVNLVRQNSWIATLLDVGTGSGAIAISVKSLFPHLNVTALDNSPEALKVAQYNNQRLGTKVNFIQSDLFDHVDHHFFDIIVSNPPYLDKDEIQRVQAAGKSEPLAALDGGENGTVISRKIIRSSLDYLKTNGYLIIEESDIQYQDNAACMATEGYYNIKPILDLAGLKRGIVAQKKSPGWGSPI